MSDRLRKDIYKTGYHFTDADSAYFVNNLANLLDEDPEVVASAFSDVMNIDMTHREDRPTSLERYWDESFSGDVKDIHYKINIDTLRDSFMSSAKHVSKPETFPYKGDAEWPSTWKSSIWHEGGHGVLESLYGYTSDKSHPRRSEILPEWLETEYAKYKGVDKINFPYNNMDNLIKLASEYNAMMRANEKANKALYESMIESNYIGKIK